MKYFTGPLYYILLYTDKYIVKQLHKKLHCMLLKKILKKGSERVKIPKKHQKLERDKGSS